MKKEVFVFVNSENIRIVSDQLVKNIDFKEKEIRNANADIIALLVRENLDEYSVPDSDIILIPGSEYAVCSEKVTSHAKKQNIEESSEVDYFKRVLKPKIDQNSFIFRQSSQYIYNGKTYSNYDAIPLLQRFFKNKQTSEFDRVFMSKLLSSLEANEIGVKGIIADVSLEQCFSNSDNNINRKIFLSFGIENSRIGVVEDGKIIKNLIVDCGMTKIVENISNTFDLSIKTSEKLAEMYGFVFLPKEYVNYTIDIPVYGKLMQSVSMTELSYCIRESLKEIYCNVINELSSKMKDYDINSDFLYSSSFNINGDSTLLNLILNKEIINCDWNSLDYTTISNVYDSLISADKSEQINEAEVEQVTKEETESQPALFYKITSIFNSRIKPYLVDPEI